MAQGCKRGCRSLVIAAFLLSLALAAGAAWLWSRYDGFAKAPIQGLPADASVLVERGDSFPRVLRKLREQGIVQGSDLEWRLLARRLDTAGRLKVGEYALPPGITPSRLLANMRDGKVIQHRVTIIEGWNIRQVREALRRASPLRQEAAGLDDAALMEALGHPGQHPEGRFLPDTYVYTRNDSDLDVLRRAYAAMQRALDEAWAARAPDLPIKSAEEALVLASIIEKETGHADERRQIAGVFTRRLRIGMKLQTDPTVIYGMGSRYDGNIRKSDLLTDTPYNTYTRFGLPPTPIAMPGREALMAAVNPAPGESLYFVAIGDGSGRHVFSNDLAGHNAAVAQYLQQLRAAREKEASKQ